MNLNLKKLEEEVVLAKSELKAREEMAKLKLVEIEKEETKRIERIKEE